MTATSKVFVSEHLRPVPDCRVQHCDLITDRSSAFPEHFHSSPAVVFLQPWVLHPLQKSVLTHALNEPWLKYTIFNLPSDPTLKHEIPQIRENKIPWKSDLEIEPPMSHPPHPNLFLAKRNFYKKKQKKQNSKSSIAWNEPTGCPFFKNWFIAFYICDVYNSIFQLLDTL